MLSVHITVVLIMFSLMNKHVQSFQFRFVNKALGGLLQYTRTNSQATEAISSATLRSLEVINSNGQKTQLNSVMKDKKSVVVFLRHLG